FIFGSSILCIRLDNPKGELSHLPSMIQLGSIRGFVFYNGQPKECRKCGYLNHLAAQCESVFCRNCKNHGHVSKTCTVPMNCNLCGATNHRFRDCASAYANKNSHLNQYKRYYGSSKMCLFFFSYFCNAGHDICLLQDCNIPFKQDYKNLEDR
uniref:CCHC-type domain-containing protein n=1 Tax=Sinocyclocheilus grahami TaxID=75366 RepID=A0A672K1Q2_SINGR